MNVYLWVFILEALAVLVISAVFYTLVKIRFLIKVSRSWRRLYIK